MASVSSASSAEGLRAEAERQLQAVAERHREAVSSMAQPGRPEAGQYVAIKVVGRAVGAVSFALRRAAEGQVPFERLVELTGWEPDLVRAALEQPVPQPRVVARLTPPGVDTRAVARSAAGFCRDQPPARIRPTPAGRGRARPGPRRRGAVATGTRGPRGTPRSPASGLALLVSRPRPERAVASAQQAMPVYVYRRADGSIFELEQRITVSALANCPTTGQRVSRVMQPFSARYKGAGFYSTDDRRAPPSDPRPDPAGQP